MSVSRLSQFRNLATLSRGLKSPLKWFILCIDMLFKVKALDPDNQVEVTQLSELYKAAYGDRFKLARVNEASFWAVKSSFRFSTLLVYAGNKVVASVALRKDRDNEKHVQLYMPAIHPEFIVKQDDIGRSLKDFIQKLADRQEWELTYSYQFLQMEDQAEFAALLVDGTETALWPSSLPLNPVASKGLGPVLVSMKVLTSGMKDKLNLYAPVSHLNFCVDLYRRLGINVSFNENQGSDISSLHGLSADKRAFERRVHQNAGFSLSFIEPSLFKNFDQLKSKLTKQSESADYIALDLIDPLTPEFAQKLEELGFQLGGLLPYIRNRHNLLYFRTTTQADLEYLKDHSFLCAYLLNRKAEKIRRQVKKLPQNKAEPTFR